MLKKLLIVALICAGELLALFCLQPPPDSGMKVVELNALVNDVQEANGDYASVQSENLGFVVLDENRQVIFSSLSDFHESILQAAAGGSAVLPVKLGGSWGTLIAEPLERQAEQSLAWQYFGMAAGFVFVSAAGMLIYLFWIDRRIVAPYRNIREVAEQIARGNLGVPLQMDKGSVFGAFTEAFDLMRTELQRSQKAKVQADAARKELIAKLSHDLRTPLASIQAVSEVGALTAQDNDRKRFEQIAGKTVQLHLLVSNLLNASLGDEQEFIVMPRVLSANEVCELLEGADYRHWLQMESLPACCVWCDPVRLQQIFDNIVANAYKYGRRPLDAAGYVQEGDLFIEFEDAGGGVHPDDLGSLSLRYFRGQNAKEASGGGLGLYICNQLLRAMNGELLIRNGEKGLQVTIILPLAVQSPSLRES